MSCCDRCEATTPYHSPVPTEPLDDDPIAVFQDWLAQAKATPLQLPEAMALATVDGNGNPAVRFVLCRSVDDRGITFFTNYESAKARDLAQTPRASVAFHWEPLERQVRIGGAAERTSADETDAYFRRRARGSQISAWASPQSQPVADRAELDRRWDDVDARFHGTDEIPSPPHWGGFRILWETIEFWQGRPNRFHDRVRYDLIDGRWRCQRLAP